MNRRHAEAYAKSIVDIVKMRWVISVAIGASVGCGIRPATRGHWSVDLGVGDGSGEDEGEKGENAVQFHHSFFVGFPGANLRKKIPPCD